MSDSVSKTSDFPGSVLVAIADQSLGQIIVQTLEGKEIPQVDLESDGAQAWRKIQEQAYQLVVMDWKLPNLSGDALFNRIRQLPAYKITPIIIASGHLQDDDFRLLEEIPLTGHLKKGFATPLLVRVIKDVMKEARWLGEKLDILERIFSTLGGDGGQFLAAISELLNSAPKPIPLALRAASLLMEGAHLKEAQTILLWILKKSPNCLLAMTELGKLYLRTQRYDQAKAILKNAEALSPKNLERLCLLGDAHMKTLETDEARVYFDKALAIDSSNELAVAGNKLSKNIDDYLSTNSASGVPNSFASLLNAIGVAMVRTDQFDQGLEHYQSAMDYVSDDQVKSKLAFNLGLGYMRWKKPEEALPWFSKSVTLSGGSFTKAASKLETLKERYGLEVPEHDGRSNGIDDSLAFDEIPIDLSQYDISTESPKDGDFFEGTEGGELHANPGATDSIDDDLDLDEQICYTSPTSHEALSKQREPVTEEQMIEQVPEVVDLKKMIAQAGAHVDSNIKRLLELFASYREADFREAVKQALKDQTPLANDVAFRLQKFRKVA